MEFGRLPGNDAERELVRRCYKAGMKNGWASGKFAMADGDFIVEEDRLNPHSIIFIDDERELEKFFNHGNWCLGMGVIHKNLFFLQQINGGDEWATHEITPEHIKQFESITARAFIKDGTFRNLMSRMLQGSQAYWKGV